MDLDSAWQGQTVAARRGLAVELLVASVALASKARQLNNVGLVALVVAA